MVLIYIGAIKMYILMSESNKISFYDDTSGHSNLEFAIKK